LKFLRIKFDDSSYISPSWQKTAVRPSKHEEAQKALKPIDCFFLVSASPFMLDVIVEYILVAVRVCSDEAEYALKLG
jgi:hypothetical protein